MFRLAWRNLIQDKLRLVLSAGGLGLALALVLFFDAVFAGATDRLTVYIDNAGADVWVSQEGVRAMHMSASTIRAEVTEQVEAVEGVDQAVPILFATEMIQAEGSEYIAYVFGLPDGATLGQPWNIVAGTRSLAPGEIVIDRSIAGSAGIGVGDQVNVLARDRTIAGLTSGTATLASSVAIVPLEDFAAVRGEGAVVSFVLVAVEPDETPEVVAGRIADSVPGVTVQTSEQFAEQERELARDMSADIIGIMNAAGFFTGLAVVALTTYIAAIARKREYGVLKAMGMRNSRLYAVIVIQALLAVGMGLAAAVLLTLVLSQVIPRLDETLVLSVSAASLARVTVVSVFIAGLAALLPARQIAGLEPVAIIRRG